MGIIKEKQDFTWPVCFNTGSIYVLAIKSSNVRFCSIRVFLLRVPLRSMTELNRTQSNSIELFRSIEFENRTSILFDSKFFCEFD